MNAARPVVLGLSHLYGEAGTMDAQLAYWKGAGLEEEFRWDLPVSDEKRRTLLAHRSTSVSLHYLRWPATEQVPGLELLRHNRAAPSERAKPLLALFLSGPSGRELRDPCGNRVVTHPTLTERVTVSARVPDPGRAGRVLEKLGFTAAALGEAESSLLGSPSAAWSVRQALFPQRSFRIALVADGSAPERPTVDLPGLSGLSLWTPSLEVAGARVSLVGRQRIEQPDAVKEVAFHSGDGLLLEFLQATRRGAREA